MERVMSVEDRIRKAEEIYNKRKNLQNIRNTTKVNIREKKDIKLLKKMIIQIVVCLAIYSVFYLVKNNNYIFSEDLINKTKEILSYDMDFYELYNQIKNNFVENNINLENNVTEEIQEEVLENTQELNSSIGGAEEVVTTEITTEISQMDKDVIDIKSAINFISPVDGVVTSTYGERTPTTSTVPKNHTGIDIANVSGTIIYSATDGEVILASSEGDYRQSFKNSNRRYSFNLCAL